MMMCRRQEATTSCSKQSFPNFIYSLFTHYAMPVRIVEDDEDEMLSNDDNFDFDNPDADVEDAYDSEEEEYDSEEEEYDEDYEEEEE